MISFYERRDVSLWYRLQTQKNLWESTITGSQPPILDAGEVAQPSENLQPISDERCCHKIVMHFLSSPVSFQSPYHCIKIKRFILIFLYLKFFLLHCNPGTAAFRGGMKIESWQSQTNTVWQFKRRCIRMPCRSSNTQKTRCCWQRYDLQAKADPSQASCFVWSIMCI